MVTFWGISGPESTRSRSGFGFTHWELSDIPAHSRIGGAASARSRLNPLSPILFLVRNPGQTVPLTLVIVMSVLLIAGIVAMLNSIPTSIRTIYGYNKEFVAVWPRGDPELTEQIAGQIAGAPHLGNVFRVRVAIMRVKTIIGQWPFVLFGAEQRDMKPILSRIGLRITEGRLPEAGEAGVVISRAVARNRGYRIGSVVLSPDVQEEWSLIPARVVGIADGEHWFVLGSTEFIQKSFLGVDMVSLMVMADKRDNQPIVDKYVTDKLKAEAARARVFSFDQLIEDMDRDLATLYVILNIVIAALVTLLATMMGMLANIHFSQRMVEFGLLQAVGYSRAMLLWRAVLETVYVVVGSWLIGIALSHFSLEVVRALVMEPKGYPMETADWSTYRYTLPVPFAIALFATATVWLRFRRFDPVAIVERRLV